MATITTTTSTSTPPPPQQQQQQQQQPDNSSLSSTTTSTTQQKKKREITMDDVLYQRAREPFSLRALFNYLDTVSATELLDFWVAALDVRNMYEPTHPRSSYSMNKWELQQVEEDHPNGMSSGSGSGVIVVASGSSPATLLDDDLRERTESLQNEERIQALERAKQKDEEINKRYAEAQRLMCMTYIDDDAPLCINVSEVTRKRVTSKKPPEGGAPVTGLFDECMLEAERLIKTNHFEKFMKLAVKADETRPKVEAHPPPRPRQSQIIKGKIRTKEQIEAIVPKSPPPE
jgi:hypothetical protein